uniref:GPI ethanolamine phosphate transferase 2 C-terminal domain-containing protein n=1 Tax=Ciona intestinalis TaxID=7719 RepID=H2XP51_CIOIN
MVYGCSNVCFKPFTMKTKRNLIICYFISFFGLLLFIKGFFPMKSGTAGIATSSDIPPAPTNDSNLPSHASPIKAPFTKLVIIIVDGMRLDFIQGNHLKGDMPFLYKALHAGNALSFTSHAEAPTVTMPRLKSLTTGSIPGFIDVVFNLDQSSALKEDNIIGGMRRNGRKMVFYGDDTWIKLFPESFTRKNGTTSFFVSDYTEVDNNVTWNLEQELQNNKAWDVMILHYLGLDHIGHLFGPKSTLVGPKLREMDEVFKRIYSEYEKNRHLLQKDTLIVLTSDHGMSAHGSHGGTTQPETATPLVFLSPSIHNKQDKFKDGTEIVEQIDFASTISILMGIPIPLASVGSLISPMLQSLVIKPQNISPKDLLHSLQYNCHHLLRGLSMDGKLEQGNEDNAINLYRYKSHINGLQFHGSYIYGDATDKTHTLKAAVESYQRSQKLSTDLLTSDLAKYNYGWMGVGFVVLFMLVYLVAWGNEVTICVSYTYKCIKPSIVWLRCKHLTTKPWCQYCQTISTLNVIFSWLKTLLRYKRGSKFPGLAPLVGGFTLHIITLSGSSFVEEEHQIWNFLTASLSLGLLVAVLRATFPRKVQQSHSSLRLRKEVTIEVPQWKVVPVADSDNSQPHSGDGESEIYKDHHKVINPSYYKAVAMSCVFVMSHRVLRSWNQSGVKHAEDPDIGDWFNLPENKIYLSLLSVVSLSLLFFLLEVLTTTRDCLRSILSMVAFIMVYLYRVCTGVMKFKFKNDSEDPNIGLFESRIVFLILGILILKIIFHKEDSVMKMCDCVQSSVVIMSSLLVRPHNHFVIVLNLGLYLVLFSYVVKYLPRHPQVTMAGCHFWLLLFLTFYNLQGNSNSLATVDLSAAYIGLSGSEGVMNSTMTFILGSFATYIGHIIWISLCYKTRLVIFIYEYSKKDGKLSAHCISKLWVRLFPLIVYTIVVTGHRHHLFIWSVFSPKLLYDVITTFVYGWIIFIAALLWLHILQS